MLKNRRVITCSARLRRAEHEYPPVIEYLHIFNIPTKKNELITKVHTI